MAICLARPSHLFAAGLDAIGRSVAFDLIDPVAFRMGLEDGSAVLQAGTASFSGSERAVSVITAYAWAPPPELFGTDMRARVWLQNVGPAVVLGLGDGYTMRSGITIPGVRDAAGNQTVGLVNSVVLYDSLTSQTLGLNTPLSENPEPATLALIPAAFILLFVTRWRTQPAAARSRGGRAQARRG